MFRSEVLLITGGTGTFGHAVLNRFLDTDIREIRIFSRDEKKQDDMRIEYGDNERIKFHIGDVRDANSVRSVMRGVDCVFHAAALKQVPSCEFFPLEAAKTNIFGTENVLSAAIEYGVKKIICLSTDKAVYPINAMGISKAMMEKVAAAKARVTDPSRTTICCTRYGNFLVSRGSVIPHFVEQIKAGKPLTVTNPAMTRFIMTLEDAVDLVLFAFEHAKSGDLMVHKTPACTIETLAEALKELFDPDAETKIIGIRHGEKMHETLLTKEECARAEDLGDFFRVPLDRRDLNYGKYRTDAPNAGGLSEFNSNNAERLDKETLKQRLLLLPYIQEQLALYGARGTNEAERPKGSREKK